MNLRHITLHQLRLFNSLGQHLSFTRAAEELHLSQPVVSIQIKRLEESTGMPLVDKMGKRIFLTSVGTELFDASRDVLDRLKVLNEDMIGMEAGIKGPLSMPPLPPPSILCLICWVPFCGIILALSRASRLRISLR